MSAIPAWARVGAKVVCVDDSRGDANHAPGYVKGAVYIISDVWVVGATPACRLTAFPRGDARLNRFRPLITIEDDIATHFRQHLDVREPEGV